MTRLILTVVILQSAYSIDELFSQSNSLIIN